MNAFILILIFAATGNLLSGPVFIYRREPAARNQQPTTGIDWQGLYRYGEVGGKNTGMVIDYAITIYQENGVLVADLEADGFQTQKRIACMVKTSGNRLDLLFKSYRKDNMFELYQPGERLLSLEMKNRRLLTYWGAIEPQLTSFKNGGVYFTKRKR